MGLVFLLVAGLLGLLGTIVSRLIPYGNNLGDVSVSILLAAAGGLSVIGIQMLLSTAQ